MEDISDVVPEDWQRHGCGVPVSGEMLRYICCAGDTWLFATSTAQPSHMVRTLEEAALRMAGM